MPTTLDAQSAVENLIRDIDSFSGDALTEPLPETMHLHGAQLDPSGPTLPAEDPVLRCDEAIARLVKRIPASLTGKAGKELPDLLEQVVMLTGLEQCATPALVRKLVRHLEDDYIAALPADTTILILDVDTTEDPAHGQQEFVTVHGGISTGAATENREHRSGSRREQC